MDASILRPGTRVDLSDGSVEEVRGCYMSADGLVLMCSQPGQVVQRNVPLSMVVGQHKENT